MTLRKNGRNSDGTFAVGNSGKPKGARHKATLVALSLLEGETEAITRQAVTMALNGDATALRLCLERIIPRKRDAAVKFDLPEMSAARDAGNAASAVLDAVAHGELTPHEGSHIMALIESYRRTLETVDLDARLSVLEQRTT